MNKNFSRYRAIICWLLILPCFLNADRVAIPLFTKYPMLQATVGYASLGVFPTPIKKIEKFGTLIGANNLYLKNDGESGLIFGGNKVRKLEFVLGDALVKKSETIMAVGDAGSNCTTAIAAYCKKLGLKCICMHAPQDPTAYLRRNLLLSKYFNADLHWYSTDEQRDQMVIAMCSDYFSATGKNIYFIPSGASNEYGVIGFINAAFELNEQIKRGEIKTPDYVYVALGSTGTAVGLAIGLALVGLKTVVIPVCIQPEIYPGQEHDRYANLYNKTCQFLHQCDPTVPLLSIEAKDVFMRHDFVGAGYGKTTQDAALAIQLLQQCEGIKLDGTYTGKAFAAMLSDIAYKNIKDKVILFWNTFCSGEFSDIVSTIDYKTLPKEYHQYFVGPLQKGDMGV